MKKNNQTSHIGELLNKTTFGEMMKDNKIGQIMKYSTIFSFWDSIVGAKFSKFTKPYAIKYNKLYISTKSPIITQELSMYKNKIIKNVNSYSLPLGIEIKDIIFNYKNYTVTLPETLSNKIEDKPIKITNSQLEEITLDDKTKNTIKQNIDKINFLNEEQKKNFAKKIELTYKVKNLQDK